MRTLLLLAYRVILVFVLVSFFSFATLDQPVLRSVYVALTSIQSAFADTFRFAFDIFDSGEDLGIVLDAYTRSLTLMLLAVAIGSLAGLALGLVSGLRPRSPVAGLASAVSYVGVLTPSFLLAVLVLLLFIRYVGPAFGARFVLLSPEVTVFDVRRLIAPALVLSVRPMAFMTQVTIGALQEVIYSDYVRTARAKGLLRRTILLRHVLRNIAAPALTSLNSSFYFSLSSLLIVEWLFNWGGVGVRLLDAAADRDAEMASYFLVSIGITFLVLNTVVKVIIRRVDPRLNEAGAAVS